MYPCHAGPVRMRLEQALELTLRGVALHVPVVVPRSFAAANQAWVLTL